MLSNPFVNIMTVVLENTPVVKGAGQVCHPVSQIEKLRPRDGRALQRHLAGIDRAGTKSFPVKVGVPPPPLRFFKSTRKCAIQEHPSVVFTVAHTPAVHRPQQLGQACGGLAF